MKKDISSSRNIERKLILQAKASSNHCQVSLQRNTIGNTKYVQAENAAKDVATILPFPKASFDETIAYDNDA